MSMSPLSAIIYNSPEQVLHKYGLNDCHLLSTLNSTSYEKVPRKTWIKRSVDTKTIT